MDCVELLHRMHSEIDDVCRELERLSCHAIKSRQILSEHVLDKLRLCRAMEEDVLYPAILAELPQLHSLVRARQPDNTELERAMNGLHRVEPSSPQFDSCVRHVRMTLRRHAAREQRDVFPEVRRRWSHRRLTTLVVDMQLRHRAMTYCTYPSERRRSSSTSEK